VKETIFHPEARAEMREAVEFYEARLEGLGLRFLSAMEQTAERISTHAEAGAPLTVNSVNGSFLVFLTTSSIASGKIIFTSLPSLINTVGQDIGGSELTVANHRLKNGARRAHAS
jgi:hypothetical protein